MCAAWQSVPKGGEPAYRNGDQYKDTFGKRQGEMLAAHEQEYGYGPYAKEPYRSKANPAQGRVIRH